ncbi:beta-phosphoglucomutase [Prolixibacter sp. NT017]|uniref:beta-phosphoglucomutase n=1 Tax=Prolixibacter sp. NT017 TaxID=2652390 RepID=UPI0012732228|nr:beta-phosphoglucomutase [Prolixibacter sp. NT017]GET27273.1 beta-phosphoglucomutase [Prolixibacter sp. NT017]
MTQIKACLFDLDGVVVDTAKYHFIAWKELANELGFDFTEADNERLKGVSRVRSLEILLEIGGIELDDERKEQLAAQKNENYVSYIRKMKPDEILPGVEDFLGELKKNGILIALGSASKNAPLILKQIGLTHLFDAIIDGNSVSKAKPDPEVFLKGAEALNVEPTDCVVFEDAQAGIEAARNAGMHVIGIGHPDNLKNADFVMPGFEDMNIDKLKFN